MRGQSKPSKIIIIFGFFFLLILVGLAIGLGSTLGDDNKRVSPENSSASDNENLTTKKYESQYGFAFDYDINDWSVLPANPIVEVQLKNRNTEGILTIIVASARGKDLNSILIEEKNSLTALSTSFTIDEEQELQTSDKTMIKLVYTIQMIGADAPVKQSRYILIQNDKVIKFNYSYPAAKQGDFSEFDLFVRNIQFSL